MTENITFSQTSYAVVKYTALENTRTWTDVRDATAIHRILLIIRTGFSVHGRNNEIHYYVFNLDLPVGVNDPVNLLLFRIHDPESDLCSSIAYVLGSMTLTVTSIVEPHQYQSQSQSLSHPELAFEGFRNDTVTLQSDLYQILYVLC